METGNINMKALSQKKRKKRNVNRNRDDVMQEISYIEIDILQEQ